MSSIKRRKIANFFGGLGYLALILQWVWALVLLLPPLLKLHSVQVLLLPPVSSQPAQPVVPSSPPIFFMILIVAFAIIVALIGTIYALKMPVEAARKADKTTKKASRALAQHVAHHPQDVGEIRRLSRRMLWIIKWTLVLLGLIATVTASVVTSSLPDSVIIVVGIYLAAWSVLWFGLQYIAGLGFKYSTK